MDQLQFERSKDTKTKNTWTKSDADDDPEVVELQAKGKRQMMASVCPFHWLPHPHMCLYAQFMQ